MTWLHSVYYGIAANELGRRPVVARYARLFTNMTQFINHALRRSTPGTSNTVDRCRRFARLATAPLLSPATDRTVAAANAARVLRRRFAKSRSCLSVTHDNSVAISPSLA